MAAPQSPRVRTSRARVAIDRTLGPTDLTHELLAYATDEGKHDEAWIGMFQDHFSSNRQLWSIDQLVEFADEIGLDPHEARSVLESRRYRRQVTEEQRRAERMGARGTPFIVIDEKYGIGGGVDTSTLLNAIDRAWTESQPPTIVTLGVGDACEIDGSGSCAS